MSGIQSATSQTSKVCVIKLNYITVEGEAHRRRLLFCGAHDGRDSGGSTGGQHSPPAPSTACRDCYSRRDHSPRYQPLPAPVLSQNGVRVASFAAVAAQEAAAADCRSRPALAKGVHCSTDSATRCVFPRGAEILSQKPTSVREDCAQYFLSRRIAPTPNRVI